jgi:acetoin utilization protein AcuB
LIMLVRDRMSRRVIAVRPQDSIEHARKQMERYEVRHLPVIRAGRLIGIVSDRDLRGGEASRVQEIMTVNPISVPPDASMDEAARVMEAVRISCLPVVESKRVVGILTTTGILRAFVDLSGAAERTTRIVLMAKTARGAEAKVRHIVHECRGDLKWLYRQGRRIHLRLRANDDDAIVSALEAAGLEVVTVIVSRDARNSAVAPKPGRRVSGIKRFVAHTIATSASEPRTRKRV